MIRVLACDKSLNKRQVDMVELAAARLLFNKGKQAIAPLVGHWGAERLFRWEQRRTTVENLARFLLGCCHLRELHLITE